MLTVVLAGNIDAIRPHVDEHLPGARMRYNSKKAMTAIQHPELADMGEEGVRRIVRAYQLPFVCCVNIKPFSRSRNGK